jgi:hypothetical protein
MVENTLTLKFDFKVLSFTAMFDILTLLQFVFSPRK